MKILELNHEAVALVTFDAERHTTLHILAYQCPKF